MGRSSVPVLPNNDVKPGGRKAMAAAEAGVQVETEIERIEGWRAEELERAGYPAAAAEKLAVRHDVDLHVAGDLLRSGCSVDLALGILL
jgi:hypothetical protein